MPRRELKTGKQVADWLAELGTSLKASGNLTLIGSAALLWHAHDRGVAAELPEASMDLDPVTDSDEVATHCYEALIGSEFERIHGWHVNLMPESVSTQIARWVGTAHDDATDWKTATARARARRPACAQTAPQRTPRPRPRRMGQVYWFD